MIDIQRQREIWRKASKKKREKPEYKAKEYKYYQEWYKKNGRNRSDDYLECILEWAQEHPDRVKVMGKLGRAVKSGKIKKPKTCENCGRETRL